MVTWENYEEYLVMQVDGELDAAGQQELEAFMQLHPEVRAELALFETVRLAPDETQVFSNKESLLKDEPKGMVINFTQWFRYGVAAGLALLITLGIMKWQGADNNTEIAAKDTAAHTEAPIAKTVDTTMPAPQQQEVLVKQEEPREQIRQEVTQPRRVVQQQPLKVEIAMATEKKKMPVELPGRIEIADAGKLEVNIALKNQPRQVAIPTLPTLEKHTAPEPNQEELLAWLPVDDERKQGLNLVGDAITERVERVKEIRNSIRNTDVAVKLGKKELFTVRF